MSKFNSGDVLKCKTSLPDKFFEGNLYPVLSKDFDQHKGFTYGIMSEKSAIEYFDEEDLEAKFNLYKSSEIKKDNVNHPPHYTWLKDICGVEPIDICREFDFNLGNALKYIFRCGHKEEEGMSLREKTIEDLEKAIFYLKNEIELCKKKSK